MTDKVGDIPLIDAILYKKIEAFQFLYDHSWKDVSQHISDNGGNSRQAREIFHASILKLYELIFNNKIHNKDEVELPTLLTQIAHFKWLMHTQPDRIVEFMKSDSQKDNTLSILSEVLQDDAEFKLQPRLHKLNVNCQKVLQSYFWDGLSIKQIATQFNISEDEVETQKNECLARMV